MGIGEIPVLVVVIILSSRGIVQLNWQAIRMYLGPNNGPREPRVGQDPFIDIQLIPALLIVHR